MLLGLEGEAGVGKTTLAYSAPLPIVGFQWDIGWQRAIYGGKHQELFAGVDIVVEEYKPATEPTKLETDIRIYELPPPLQLDTYKTTGSKKLWDYFLMRLADALTDPRIKTIVLDTATVARRVKADAYLEELQAKDANRQQLIQIEWGRPNDAIRDIYNMAQGTRKNLVSTHHLTDEYKAHIKPNGEVEQVPTGTRILEGLSKTDRLVDCHIRLEKVKAEVRGTWLKCGYSLGYEGTSVMNPTWSSLVDLIELVTGDKLKLEHREPVSA